jgi:hypothetical protein
LIADIITTIMKGDGKKTINVWDVDAAFRMGGIIGLPQGVESERAQKKVYHNGRIMYTLRTNGER